MISDVLKTNSAKSSVTDLYFFNSDPDKTFHVDAAPDLDLAV
jgi:hypothetical protein